MANDMVETIRAGLAAWGRGDLEGAMQGLDPEIEFVSSRLFPGVDPIYRGYGGFRRFWTDFRETWEKITFEVEHLAAGESSCFAAVGHFEATGRDGIDVGRLLGMVFTIRDEAIIRIQSFGTWEEAFEAAGVPTAQRAAYR